MNQPDKTSQEKYRELELETRNQDASEDLISPVACDR